MDSLEDCYMTHKKKEIEKLKEERDHHIKTCIRSRSPWEVVSKTRTDGQQLRKTWGTSLHVVIQLPISQISTTWEETQKNGTKLRKSRASNAVEKLGQRSKCVRVKNHNLEESRRNGISLTLSATKTGFRFKEESFPIGEKWGNLYEHAIMEDITLTTHKSL